MIKLKNFCYDQYRKSKKQNSNKTDKPNPYVVIGKYCGGRYDKISAIKALLEDEYFLSLNNDKMKSYLDVLWYAYVHENDSMLLSFVKSSKVRYLFCHAPITGFDIKQIVNSHCDIYKENPDFYMHELYFNDMYVAKHTLYNLRYNSSSVELYLKRM